MSKCQICRKDSVRVLLDYGSQPLCNRFVKDTDAEEYKHPLILGQCETCGLMQLTQPVPDEEIVPRFKWLSYNEPEGHLNQLSEVAFSLPGISTNSTVCGVSFKDHALLRRLKNKKIRHTWCIDPREDLGITIPGAGTETVQAYLTSESGEKVAENHGKADIVIARHIYEHASDTHRFLDTVKKLVAPGGYVIFEVPDCTEVLDSKDYSMLWEEHNLYFTPPTFYNSFNFTDFSLIRYECYSYPVENALVGIVKLSEENGHSPVFTRNALKGELARGSSYVEGLNEHAEKLKLYLKEYKQQKGNIAVFGAGHLACMYINLMEIKDYIEFVVDDNPNKKGLYMPGSHLPIYGSDSLIREKISLCLLTLRPEKEPQILEKNTSYINKGGGFASIFPSSKIWLDFLSCEKILK